MNSEGLDVLDDKILEILRCNARETYSEIGERVGLSRVAVKNRIEVLEKKGIIQGYRTIINPAKAPNSIEFVIDVEAIPELYQSVVDALVADELLRKVYSTTGECRLHAMGVAPNVTTMENHVHLLFENIKGIRKISWHLLLSVIKDEDGGVEDE